MKTTINHRVMKGRALKSLIALANLIPAILVSAESGEPLNVLFIAVDDFKAIGTLFEQEKSDFLKHIYPDSELRRRVAERMTPNFQRLANASVSFMNAHCASPACVPSRAALMTGIRPHVSGLAANEGGIFFRHWEYEGERPLAEATTLPELLKANGWYTASTGKIYHNPREYSMQDGERSWVDWTRVTEDAGSWSRSVWCTAKDQWGQLGDDRSPYTKMNDFRAADFIGRVLENGRATYGDATFVLPEGTPFFLACGIFKPHLPFNATKDMLDLFPVEEMTVTYELLEYFIADGADLPPQAFRFGGLGRDDEGDPVIGRDRFVDILEQGQSVDPDEGDLKGWKDMLMHYFACVAVADRAMGRLLDAQENSKYAENTMIILWGDHGYHLGEKLHLSKFTLWEDSTRVPFFIRDPRHPGSAGLRCDVPVSLMDIFPTVASMAKLSLPDERITGHDLGPLLKDPSAPWKNPAHVTFHRNQYHQMVRTERYKLIQYGDDGGQIELYDLMDDPEEYHNVAGNPATAELEADMKALLQTALVEGRRRQEN